MPVTRARKYFNFPARTLASNRLTDALYFLLLSPLSFTFFLSHRNSDEFYLTVSPEHPFILLFLLPEISPDIRSHQAARIMEASVIPTSLSFCLDLEFYPLFFSKPNLAAN